MHLGNTGLTPASGSNEHAVSRFVESFASALVDAGVPHMPALVFVTLLATNASGLTAEELAAELQVSRAAVSGAVNYLGHVGLTSRERQPGTRRYRYVLQDPSWYELVARRERLLDRWIATTREGVHALGATTPAGRRVAESLAFFEFLRTEMSALLARWREQHANDAPRESA
jgi:DNA-binding transcriptional regulator GbsR (MarR family)